MILSAFPKIVALGNFAKALTLSGISLLPLQPEYYPSLKFPHLDRPAQQGINSSPLKSSSAAPGHIARGSPKQGRTVWTTPNPFGGPGPFPSPKVPVPSHATLGAPKDGHELSNLQPQSLHPTLPAPTTPAPGHTATGSPYAPRARQRRRRSSSPGMCWNCFCCDQTRLRRNLARIFKLSLYSHKSLVPLTVVHLARKMLHICCTINPFEA